MSSNNSGEELPKTSISKKDPRRVLVHNESNSSITVSPPIDHSTRGDPHKSKSNNKNKDTKVELFGENTTDTASKEKRRSGKFSVWSPRGPKTLNVPKGPPRSHSTFFNAIQTRLQIRQQKPSMTSMTTTRSNRQNAYNDNNTNKVSLRFKSANLEQKYQRNYSEKIIRYIRLGILIFLILEGLVGISDLAFITGITESNFIVELVVLRYAVVCPIFIILYLLLLNRRLRVLTIFPQVAMALSSFCVFAVFQIQRYFTRDYSYSIYFASHVTLVLVYIFSLSTLQWPYAISLFGVMTCLFVPLTILFESNIFFSLFSYFFTGIVFLVTCYLGEVFARKNFVINQIVNQERELIEREKFLSQNLLMNIVPKTIIEKFKRDKSTLVEEFDDCTFFFSDVVSFTEISASQTPDQLVTCLDNLFSRFDRIVAKYDLEKIKTIGDAYMAVGGVPIRNNHHAEDICKMALEVLEEVEAFNQTHQTASNRKWNIRIGVHTGHVVGGVIGKKKFLYDVYGPGIDTAMALEAHGSPGKIHISEAIYLALKDRFECVPAGDMTIGEEEDTIKTYFLVGPLQNPVIPLSPSPSRGMKTSISQLSMTTDNPIWKWLKQEIDDLSNTKIHKLRLTFNTPEIESELGEEFFKKSKRQVRIALVSLLSVLLLLELPVLQNNTAFSTIGLVIEHLARLVVFALGLSILILSNTGSRIDRKNYQIAITVANGFLAAYIFTMGFFFIDWWQFLFMVHLFNFSYTRTLFQYASVSSTIIQLAQIVTLVTNGTDALPAFIFSTIVFFANLISSYIKERTERQTFIFEKIFVKERERLQVEQQKSEELLVNILPVSIAATLKSGTTSIADRFNRVSILFAHIVGFSELNRKMELLEVFEMVNQIICAFDDLTVKYSLEKIKTIGDVYMVAGNVPTPHSNHLVAMCDLAQDMTKFIEQFNTEHGLNLSIRIGINLGPLVAGVIGKKKFTYDLWGDVVNVASRMESTSLPGKIQVTEEVSRLLSAVFEFQERGTISVKGKGVMKTYFCLNKKELTDYHVFDPSLKKETPSHIKI